MDSANNTSFHGGRVFCRTNTSEFFREKYYFRLSRDESGSDLLNNRLFGESTFLPGCDLPMTSPYWVFQVQISGDASIRSNDLCRQIQPGDLLAVPPRHKYYYQVNDVPVEKLFITMSHSAILDIILRNDVETHGILIRKRKNDDFPAMFEAVRQAMLDRDDESCSILLYKLVYRIKEALTYSEQPMNFRQKLKNAAGKIELMTSLDALAAEFNMPKHTLIRTFRRELDTTPINYMITMRLEHAKQLLTFSELTISEIASACGYASPAFFASEFRKKYGQSPSAFRTHYFASISKDF